MKYSLAHALYCIDSIEEHARLLDCIARGVCALGRSLVPDRCDEYFKPYIIESMEFEFLDLKPSRKVPEWREKRQVTNHDRIQNLKLAPMSIIFKEVLNRLESSVRAIKMIIDFVYFIQFRGGAQLVPLIMESEYSKQMLGLTMLMTYM